MIDPIAEPSRGGFRRALMAGIWLVYLSSTVEAGWARDDVRGGLGIAATIVFAAIYLGAFMLLPGRPMQRHVAFKTAIVLLGVEISLGVAVLLLFQGYQRQPGGGGSAPGLLLDSAALHRHRRGVPCHQFCCLGTEIPR